MSLISQEGNKENEHPQYERSYDESQVCDLDANFAEFFDFESPCKKIKSKLLSICFFGVTRLPIEE